MKKWIVRLIEVYFLYGAVMAYLGIISRKNLTNGFLGFSFQFLSGPSPDSLASELDIMAIVALCVNLYIAYQLLMRSNRGRLWALVVLWLSLLSSIIGLVLVISRNSVLPTGMFVKYNFLNKSFPVPLLVSVGVYLVINLVQIYWLMNKSIKMEFQNHNGLEIQQTRG